MKGDFSRNTFNSRKRYSGVLMQQGRVQLDADWNEQLQIEHYRTETEAVDVIGLCGVPKKTDGFKLEVIKDDLIISPGRIYVDGLLCELESSFVPISFVQGQDQQAVVPALIIDERAFKAGQWLRVSADGQAPKIVRITETDEAQRLLELDQSIAAYRNQQNAGVQRVVSYTSQPDYLTPKYATAADPAKGELSKLKLDDGTYLAYLHVWEEHITALDDPLIRETALGGPDTTTRIKNVWQVELLPAATIIPDKNKLDGKQPSCRTRFKEWDDLVAASTGRMNARANFVEDDKNPCLLPPDSGYQRLENQLYRVEIQKGGPLGTATFKWSRENGSILTTIEKVQGNTFTVADVGKDEFLSFVAGGWAEIVDDEAVQENTPYQLVHINRVDTNKHEIELDALDAGFQTKKRLKLRRWDHAGESIPDALKTEAKWTSLEGGVEVYFHAGTYRAGDYWLIPARTATGDIEWPPYAIPNTKPIPQPPRGTRHHYCRLALIEVGKGATKIVDDCRKLFPTLTEICAEDVCFDNSECKLPNVETVQDAIERLCKANDLRFHNRHLHGWGIVCGLEVHCGTELPPEVGGGIVRRHVTVKPGYAIDCEGNDILVRSDASLDLMTMIEQYNKAHPNDPLFPPNQDGEVCLYLTGEGHEPYALEKYDPNANSLQSLLKGTLLMDFYKDCVKKIVDFLIEELTPKPEESKLPVGPTQKRISTFLNLLAHLINPENGQYLFLSGVKGKNDPQTEDTILRNFYNKLRALLQSHTFCAMFDGARQFPEYPFADSGIDTIFGKNFHTRLRIHPQGQLAFTAGADNKIHVFDLVGKEMIAEVEFPGGKAAIVQDVAFSADGNQLYAIGLLNNKDTMFAVADMKVTNVGGIKFESAWRTPVLTCDILLVTLATIAHVNNKVFAIGKGKGLYEINPNTLTVQPQQLYDFNAVGHLVFFDERFYATASATGASSEEYDRVLRLNPTKDTGQIPTINLAINTVPVRGSDDIALALVNNQPRLYVVVNSVATNNRGLLTYNAKTLQSPGAFQDLGENTEMRLAFNSLTKRLMLTYEDNYHVRILNSDENLDGEFRLPVQVDPIAIATSPDNQRVYVLNYTSNTINSILAKRFINTEQLDLEALAKYRREIIEAFADLFGGLLQYLKDCFCDHLLVKCPPACKPEDKLYLACISIKNNQVYKVCNFSRRKYVKSFPTIGYWLSLVPIAPFISRAVEMFCCSVLPGAFGRFNAPNPQPQFGGPNRVTGATVRKNVQFYQQTDIRSAIYERMGKLRLGGTLASDMLRSVVGKTDTRTSVAPAPPAVSRDEVVGRSVDEAKRKLEANQIAVREVVKYDPSKGATNILRVAEAPSRIEAGAGVTLYEDNGIVKFYAPDADIPTSMRNLLREEIKASAGDTASLRAQVAELQQQLASAQKQTEAALAARDAEIAELRTTTKSFQSEFASISDFRKKLEDSGGGSIKGPGSGTQRASKKGRKTATKEK